jgi:hypothetical protein
MIMEKPVYVYDARREFYFIMIFLAIESVSFILYDTVAVSPSSGLIVLEFSSLFLLLIAQILYFYRYTKRKTRVEFYEDYVRFFQGKGDPMDVHYSDLTLEVRFKTQLTKTYNMCVLSMKETGDKQSWEVPDHLVWKRDITLDRWLKIKMDNVEIA